MFDERDLREAVDLQRKSYGLLQWVSTAVRSGIMMLDRAHNYGTAAESARDWLEHHATDIPAEYQPRANDPAQLEKFTNIFSSYLLTSFDMVEHPGTRGISSSTCPCVVCVYLEAAPTLRTKRVTSADKHHAERLKRMYLRGLAQSFAQELSDARAEEIVADPELGECVALATYGSTLIERCRGVEEGVATLVLWRQFAWNRTGSPRKGFELTVEAILDAERRIRARIAG